MKIKYTFSLCFWLEKTPSLARKAMCVSYQRDVYYWDANFFVFDKVIPSYVQCSYTIYTLNSMGCFPTEITNIGENIVGIKYKWLYVVGFR